MELRQTGLSVFHTNQIGYKRCPFRQISDFFHFDIPQSIIAGSGVSRGWKENTDFMGKKPRYLIRHLTHTSDVTSRDLNVTWQTWPSLGETFQLWAEWPDLGPKWVRLGPNGTNPGFFQIRFQYILAQCQNVQNLMGESPGFVPFGPNLTHFGSKSGHHPPGVSEDVLAGESLDL